MTHDGPGPDPGIPEQSRMVPVKTCSSRRPASQAPVGAASIFLLLCCFASQITYILYWILFVGENEEAILLMTMCCPIEYNFPGKLWEI
jgi:hypothetical protein